jgi:hypothetical protein
VVVVTRIQAIFQGFFFGLLQHMYVRMHAHIRATAPLTYSTVQNSVSAAASLSVQGRDDKDHQSACHRVSSQGQGSEDKHNSWPELSGACDPLCVWVRVPIGFIRSEDHGRM